MNVVAVCDVYEPHAEAAKAWAGSECRSYGDFRRLLEQRDVDAVLVATPDHWHAAITVLACQAGKDVYVEKPLAHTIREGRKMVEAARRYNRVVQTGTQHRSAPHFRQAAEIVQSGQIGPVHFVRVWNYLNMSPDGIGRVADSDAAFGARLGFLPRSRSQRSFQQEPLPGELPLVLGLCRRHGHGLRHPPPGQCPSSDGR